MRKEVVNLFLCVCVCVCVCVGGGGGLEFPKFAHSITLRSN